MKFNQLALVAALGLGLAGTASATPVSSFFFPGELNQLSDNNAEYLINADGSLSDVNSTLDERDRLVGMFTIESIENLSGGTGTNNLSATTRELTGIFDITVFSKTSFSTPLGTQYLYTFVATAQDGTAVRLFDDGAQNYSRIDDGTGTRADRLAALMGTASDGLDFMTLGINQYWTALTNTDDISVLGGSAPGQAVNTFLASFNILTNNSGLEFEKVSCGFANNPINVLHQTDVCGSGSLLGTQGVSTPFDSFSNVDFTVRVVPEPATLGLLGLGLLGMGAMMRRRQA